MQVGLAIPLQKLSEAQGMLGTLMKSQLLHLTPYAQSLHAPCLMLVLSFILWETFTYGFGEIKAQTLIISEVINNLNPGSPDCVSIFLNHLTMLPLFAEWLIEQTTVFTYKFFFQENVLCV